MEKYIPLEKMSKKEQRAYYAQMRGSPIPPSRRGKTLKSIRNTYRRREWKER